MNDSYNQLNINYNNLQIENERLKAQQKQLSEQIAAYFVEQGSVDLLGLKKYNLAYDLIKIAICNKNPSFVFC